jgi:hypothetical protein
MFAPRLAHALGRGRNGQASLARHYLVGCHPLPGTNSWLPEGDLQPETAANTMANKSRNITFLMAKAVNQPYFKCKKVGVR